MSKYQLLDVSSVYPSLQESSKYLLKENDVVARLHTRHSVLKGLTHPRVVAELVLVSQIKDFLDIWEEYYDI